MKLLAPNGKPSNLTPEQYRLVRTTAFKKWFGDWENDAENSSKVVDENGEPLIVLHTTHTYDNDVFDKKTQTFGVQEFDAESWSEESGNYTFTTPKTEVTPTWFYLDYTNNINRPFDSVRLFHDLWAIPFFANVKKMFNTCDYSQLKKLEKYAVKTYGNNFIGLADDISCDSYGSVEDSYSFSGKGEGSGSIPALIKEIGYDGYTIKDEGGTMVIFDKGNYKLADGTNTTFDSNNADIRYKNGGLTMKKPKAKLLAPNGKQSNLTPEQYRLVRTPAFKAWFGDWENDAENSSKVVDFNGEPLVLYHGGQTKFNIFSPYSQGHYFTDNIKYAKAFTEQSDDGHLFKCFINVRNYLDARKLSPSFEINEKELIIFFKKNGIYSKEMEKSIKDFFKKPFPPIEKTFWSYLRNYGFVIPSSYKEIYDAIFLNEHSLNGTKINVYFVHESNQIKLADGTNTTFDSNNPDIRFVKGGSVVGKEINTLSSKDRLAKEKELIKYFTKYKAFRKKNPDGYVNSYAVIEEYNSIRDKIMDLKYDLRKPKKVSEIESMRERKSAIPSNIIVVAWNDLVSNKKIFDAISEAMAGVHYNKNTAIDDIVDGINRNTSIIELHDAFINTRKVLKNKYGKTITLYRSHGQQMRKSTQNWISTLEGAEQYVGNIEKKEISIENIIALNVGMDANYEEFIVYIPKSTNGYASFEGIVSRRKKFDFGGSISDLLSSQEVEDKLGRKLDSWNDNTIEIEGKLYKKVYLRPEYKLI